MKPKEELLWICQCKDTCELAGCSHKVQHKLSKYPEGLGGCFETTSCENNAKCVPFNINKNTEKQFAKFVAESRMK